MNKMLSLLAGVSMLAVAGATSAAEPLSADQMDLVTAGGNFDISQSLNTNLCVYANVHNNSATANATANATGNNTYTDAQTSTNANTPSWYVPGSSSSGSTSISIAAKY